MYMLLVAVSKLLFKNVSIFLFRIRLITLLTAFYFSTLNKLTMIDWGVSIGPQDFTWTFILDSITCFFLSTVLFIGGNVIWYRQNYIEDDKDADRFILLVFGFVGAICLLITRTNMVAILLGWDGLGLISYCLVIYYPTKKARRAGILTILSNRIGDVCLLFLVAWFSIVGDFNFYIWTNVDSLVALDPFISFFLILGALTKSAQLPFSAWLPAAIAAPTPVSALVHSSTLVTAGVFLLIRMYPLISPNMSLILIVVSCVTMFMAGIVAFYETDLKKIIALSTLRQLGVMIFAISIHLPGIAFFHLITHALFKALLFLCAGVIIHGGQDSQDIRLIGASVANFPLIGVCFNLANLSLCGFPFLAGFYSKDMIVEVASIGHFNVFILFILFLSLGLTVAYSVRLTYFSLVSEGGGWNVSNLADMRGTLRGPIINLSLISMLSGATLRWVLFPSPNLVLLPTTLKNLALVVVLLTSMVIWKTLTPNFNFRGSNFVSQFNAKIWFLPHISTSPFVETVLSLRSRITKSYDQGWLELLSRKEVERGLHQASGLTSRIQQNPLKIQFLGFCWILLVFVVLF